ncbi:hypothetical protein EVAR_68484_1 [Eumeta japonica]|uniref:Uncharacterized protein n=1 Tax=Eumeta variegata TaxID=151549 RepID=A0A4C2A852_EUMVA|nr:hypothetical protein EVAR_68484_1 [Eumeta japonica]
MYISRLKQYIAINSFKEELHGVTLIAVVAAATCDVTVDLCASAPPETKAFEELVDIVKKHLKPRRSDNAERHAFRQRRQRPEYKRALELALALETVEWHVGVSSSSGVGVAQPGAVGASAMAVNSTHGGERTTQGRE